LRANRGRRRSSLAKKKHTNLVGRILHTTILRTYHFFEKKKGGDHREGYLTQEKGSAALFMLGNRTFLLLTEERALLRTRKGSWISYFLKRRRDKKSTGRSVCCCLENPSKKRSKFRLRKSSPRVRGDLNGWKNGPVGKAVAFYLKEKWNVFTREWAQ